MHRHTGKRRAETKGAGICNSPCALGETEKRLDGQRWGGKGSIV